MRKTQGKLVPIQEELRSRLIPRGRATATGHPQKKKQGIYQGPGHWGQRTLGDSHSRMRAGVGSRGWVRGDGHLPSASQSNHFSQPPFLLCRSSNRLRWAARALTLARRTGAINKITLKTDHLTSRITDFSKVIPQFTHLTPSKGLETTA